MPVSKSKRRRYTPPPKPKPKPSPNWVPAIVLVLLAIGVVDLVLYYLGLPPFHSEPRWGLLVGFGFIASGFAVATQWR
ncbi:MAG: cell division protein CrgA [Actinomycetota bacterium]